MTKAVDLAKTGSLVNSSGQIDLTTGVTGVLPVANGGTGSSSGVSPGGSTTQVQYNNAGAFGGDSGFVYSGGNVGIGATSPSYRLHVSDSSGTNTSGTVRLGLGTSYYGELKFNQPSDQVQLTAAGTSQTLGFFTGATPSERMRIDSSGNVGIGTSSPVANTPLTLQAASGYTDTLWLKSVGTNIDSRINIAPTGTGLAQINNTTGTPLAFQISGVERGRFDASGNFLFNSGYGSVATAYGCRAWVNFNGDGSSGTNQTIRGSGNISSVYKNSAGNYTVNFTTAMPDTNYSGIGSCAYSGGTYVSQNIGVSSFSTGSCTVKSQAYNGASYDATWICVAFFR